VGRRERLLWGDDYVSFEEVTLRLADERDRLDDRLDEYAEEAADADDSSAIDQVATQCQQRLAGVDHLIDRHGRDATVTIRGLSAGQFARVEDRVAAKRERSSQEALPGYHRNTYAATGLVEAPFLDVDPDAEADEFEQRLKAVADQPVGVVKWLESRIDDETSVAGDDFRSYAERLMENSGG
jgi:hypothetical protein